MHERTSVTDQMQREWNERAREDAHFYVAFGRRDQGDSEFFATAEEIVRGLEHELRRFPLDANRRAWRALEIGCGPGRLMVPMSKHFGEIHGIDVADEMIRRATANVAAIPHAHVRHTSGADLAPFADESFHFVYSYAVFQHIPSRDVVLSYLREARRVLKTGGILRAQINGLDQTATRYDTWSGVRFSADEIRAFAREHDMQLLTLEGARTQYMWTTMRKRAYGCAMARSRARTRIRRVTNAHNSEPVAPGVGRFASVTAWVDQLPANCDLNSLRVLIDGQEATPCYIGPPEGDGMQQLNILLPPLHRTGLLPLELYQHDDRLCDPWYVRIIPPSPAVPVVISVADGINLLSGARIVTGTVKVMVEEARDLENFSATVGGIPVPDIDIFCADPLPPRHEINLRLPEGVADGPQVLEMRIGRRALQAFTLYVAHA